MPRSRSLLSLLLVVPLVGAGLVPPARAEKEPARKAIEVLAQGTQEFAFALHRALPKGKGNVFFSPYSISEAMAMATAGARGATAEELHEGMRFGVPAAHVPGAFRALRAEIARPTNRRWPNGEPLRFRVADGFWTEQHFPLRPEYVSLLRDVFAAEARSADFRGASEAARRDINLWVGEKTGERIPELLRAGDLSADTLLVLVNAVWFKATWRHVFDKGFTRDANFTCLDGTRVEVPTMQQLQTLPYARGEGWELVQLPYALSHARMTILLPAEGTLQAFEEGLDAPRWKAMQEAVRPVSVRLRMPRLRIRGRLDLSSVLSSMGMASAFGAGADFSGMTEGGGIFISQVVHEAMLSVDEHGTEAAAATAVVMDKGRPPEPVDLQLDRPFLVLIHNTTTGAILFLGRVAAPGNGA